MNSSTFHLHARTPLSSYLNDCRKLCLTPPIVCPNASLTSPQVVSTSSTTSHWLWPPCLGVYYHWYGPSLHRLPEEGYPLGWVCTPCRYPSLPSPFYYPFSSSSEFSIRYFRLMYPPFRPLLNVFFFGLYLCPNLRIFGLPFRIRRELSYRLTCNHTHRRRRP